MVKQYRKELFAVVAALIVLRLLVVVAASKSILGISSDTIGTFLSLLLMICAATAITHLILSAINPDDADATRPETPKLLNILVVGFVWIVGVLILLSAEFNFSITGALAASGAVAVILGFALRSILLDLFFGIAFALDDEIAIGDWIEISGVNNQNSAISSSIYGQVNEISWRLTRIMLGGSQTYLLVPNSVIGQSVVTNYSKPKGPKRLRYEVRLRHGTPMERGKRVLLGAAEKAVRHKNLCAEPRPTVACVDVDGNGVTYLVSYYFDPNTTPPIAAKAALIEQIQGALQRNFMTATAEKLDLGRAGEEGQRDRFASHEAVLADVPLFSDTLTIKQLAELAEKVDRSIVSPNTTVVEQGETGDSMYLVVDGALVVRVDTDDRKDLEVAVLSAGDYFGEMSLLTGAPRTATVSTLTDATLLEIEKADMEPLLEKQQGLAAKLSKVLAERQAGLEAAKTASETTDMEKQKEGLAKQLLSKISSYFNLARTSKGGTRAAE